MMNLNLTRGAVALCAAATLTACAPSPDQIAAAPLPLDTFAGTTCSRAETLLHTAEINLASLEIRQARSARNDALGVVLLGVPTSSLQGGDKSEQIANLKGQINALEHRLEGC